MVELYFDYMRIDPKNPKWADRDRFILSKGHAAPVLYCGDGGSRLHDPKDQLNTLRKLGSIYQGHPDVRFIPCARSLHRLARRRAVSLALGMGLAARLDGRPFRTYVMLGDGEIQEGQIWEARHVRRLPQGG